MSNFLSSFLKRKKIVFFVLLFLVISGLIIPRISMAIDWNCVLNPMLSPMCIGNAIYNYFSGEETTIGDKIWNKIGDTAIDYGKQLLMAIVGGITFLLIMIFGTLANLAAALLLWVMAGGQSVSYTHITGPNANIAVQAGWPLVRDLANMIVVLGFVIIGIATALRFKEYEAKKLLPKLIVAALLINFSLLICGLFIDGSNIVMANFGTSGGYLQRTWTKNVWKQATSLADNWNPKAASDYIGKAVGLVFQDIMMVIIFLLFFFLLITRYIALWILVILSPLAFVCYVFPFTKKFFEMWWKNFFGWCIIGVPGMFFLWLSDKMAGKLSGAISSPAATSTTSGSVLTMMTYLLPGMFLLIGFLFSLQISAMGSGAAIAAAKWSGGKIGGGAKLGAKLGGKGLLAGADAATGGRVSSAYNKVSSGVDRAMVNLGLRKPGSRAQNFQNDMKESSGRIASMDRDDVTRIATGRTFTPQARKDKAAAILEKVKNNQLGDLGNTAQQARLIAETENYIKGRGGVSTLKKDASKQNPNIALDTTRSVRDPDNKAFADAIENQAPREFARNIDAKGINLHSLQVIDNKQMAALANNGSRKKRAAMDDLINNPANAAAIAAHQAALATNPAELAEFNAKLAHARTLIWS